MVEQAESNDMDRMFKSVSTSIYGNEAPACASISTVTQA